VVVDLQAFITEEKCLVRGSAGRIEDDPVVVVVDQVGAAHEIGDEVAIQESSRVDFVLLRVVGHLEGNLFLDGGAAKSNGIIGGDFVDLAEDDADLEVLPSSRAVLKVPGVDTLGFLAVSDKRCKGPVWLSLGEEVGAEDHGRLVVVISFVVDFFVILKVEVGVLVVEQQSLGVASEFDVVDEFLHDGDTFDAETTVTSITPVVEDGGTA